MAAAWLQLCVASIAVSAALGAKGSSAKATASAVGSLQASSDLSGPTPVRRVVNLLQQMQKQVYSELKEDEDIYGKMKCWCETNEREKTKAVEIAKTRIGELEAAIEQGTALAAQLTSEIAELKDDIQALQDSIDKATALREKEKAEFEDEEKDMMDTLAALKEAIPILEKVQLAQTSDSKTVPHESLLQLHRVASSLSSDEKEFGEKAKQLKTVGIYKSVMQRDLWDFLGTFNGGNDNVVTDLAQQPTGYAAGAKSYNARSSKILGILKQMQDTFNKDLASAQRAEIDAEVAFQRLRSAKEGELMAAAKALQERETRLADTQEKLAQAKVDLEETKEALAADQQFLIDLEKRCKVAADEYEKRSLTRQQEIAAISETIKILEEDDARDLFSKTVSFLQVGKAETESQRSQQRRVRASAANKILALARAKGSNTQQGWRLALLAVSVQHDGFAHVKKAMDKMIAELKKQQQEEYQKHENCVKDIQAVEEQIRVTRTEKKDLNALIHSLSATSAQLTKDVDDLKVALGEAHVSLKTASEDRKAENHEFQQVVSDQRATAAILRKAMKRMESFYGEQAFAQVSAGQEPGAPVEAPPQAGLDYESNRVAPGVIQMLAKIIQDAEAADREAVAEEQAAQQAYSQVVADINAMLDRSAASITEKTAAREKANVAKLEAEKDLRAVEESLTDFLGQEEAYHVNCDYLLTNFPIRQKARQEEIEAVQKAKAILAGANFFDEA